MLRTVKYQYLVALGNISQTRQGSPVYNRPSLCLLHTHADCLKAFFFADTNQVEKTIRKSAEKGEIFNIYSYAVNNQNLAATKENVVWTCVLTSTALINSATLQNPPIGPNF